MAIAFDGVNDYAEHATSAAIGISDWSIAFMLRTTTTAGVVCALGTVDDGSARVFQLQLNSDADENAATNTHRMHLRDASNNSDVTEFTNAGLRDGTWRRVVITVDNSAGSFSVYVSDVQQSLTFGAAGDQLGTGQNWTFQYPFFFGARNLRTVADLHADVDIADIGIYNKVLSAAEITALETDSVEIVAAANRLRGWKTDDLTELDASDSLTLNNGAAIIAGPVLNGAGGGDTTAPTLSSASGTATGANTADLSVSTDEAGGTLYWYVSTSATPPSLADLQAGTGAAFFTTTSPAATGVQSESATGLSASTQYFLHAQQEDAAGNDSTILTSTGFTTQAAPEIAYANGVLQAQAGGGGLDNKTIHYSVWDAAGGTGTPEPGNLGTETKGTFTTGTGAAAGSGTITGLTAGDYWVVLYYFDGTNWQTRPGQTLTAS